MQSKRYPILALFSLLLVVFSSHLAAQRGRITGPIDNSRRITLASHVNPRALPEFDQGRADPSKVLSYVTLVIQPTATQQAELDQLLADQQDPTSAHYHQWLTPEQFADRFGASQSDLDQAAAWLKQQNLTVLGTARARNWIAFTGTAGQIETAFKTEIHNYRVNGELHFANASNPSIPAALQGLVGAIRGLTDFRMRPAPMRKRVVQPNYNNANLCQTHCVGPGDFATIYDLKPLYSSGIDGTGQTIVVVGQTNINVSDIRQFRTFFGLAAKDPTLTLVPGEKDPGIVSTDQDEANLDIEYSGGIAPNANIIFVYSSDVSISAQYAVDQKLAPILSMSYGLCEPLTGLADARSQRAQAQQANAQGMTWLAPSGDTGAVDCYDPTQRTVYGLSVDTPASIPEVTGVGATTFNENGGNYWATTNSASNSSALSYIPELAWNESATDGSPLASGGGASSFFTKPSWQTGSGVPADNARDVPDVSVNGSVYHDGYFFYSAGSQGVVGGTSVGVPTFSGVLALISQYLASKGVSTAGGLGNVNPKLYGIAQTNPSAFHDIVSGDNKVDPCPPRVRGCDGTPVGYAAGPGYDQVTGIGSIDGYSLAVAWQQSGSAIAKGSVTLTLSSTDVAVPSNSSFTLTATLKATNGGTPTGTVTFSSGGTTLGTATVSGGTATLTVTAAQLALGNNTISAQYSGDSSDSAGSGSITVSVASPSTAAPSISGVESAASYAKAYAPGMVVAVFGSNLAAVSEGAQAVPLPATLGGVSVTVNGVTAPLYYVSPGQLNVQIPYATAVNANATLTVTNNGQTSSSTVRITSAAPGIFTDSTGTAVPSTSAARGSVATLFITGEGAVTPSLATGATPASTTAVSNLPKPTQATTISVGGVSATIQFIGIPWGLVGVTQINYQIPANAPTGNQQVIVTVGGVASPAATLNVQ
jgi:uncharacterized protein (TIGR03437 family)